MYNTGERTVSVERTNRKLSVEDFLNRMIDAVNRKFDRQGYLLLKTSEQVQEQNARVDQVVKDHRDLSEFTSQTQKMHDSQISGMRGEIERLHTRLRIAYAAVLVLTFIVALVGLLWFLGPY